MPTSLQQKRSGTQTDIVSLFLASASVPAKATASAWRVYLTVKVSTATASPTASQQLSYGLARTAGGDKRADRGIGRDHNRYRIIWPNRSGLAEVL